MSYINCSKLLIEHSVSSSSRTASKMKFLIALALAVVCANADISHLGEATATIARSTYDASENAYQWAYETSNGIAAEASGVVKNLNSDSPALEVQGSNRYTSPDGVPVVITYIANENGYQPSGDSIPVGPEIPEAIQRSLKFIAEHPYQETKAAANAVYQTLG